MPDVRDVHRDDDADARLVEALRAMPLASPGSDGWIRMESTLRARSSSVRSVDASARGGGGHRRSHSVHRWPFAVAAAVLAAVLWPQLSTRHEAGDRVDERTAYAPGGDADDTRTLIAQSQWLERLVASDAIEAVAKDADQLIIEQGLRSRIQQIDAALVNSGQPDRRLWAARVGALTQLAEVKWAGRQEGWSAMADTAAAVPAVMWSN